jgi:hypothetical protein
MKKKLETIFSLMNEIRSKVTASKFAEVALEDGTIITWDGELAVGTAIFVNDGENNVPAPEGTHKLTGEFEGKSIVLDAEGMVVEIIDETATAEMSGDEGKAEVFSKKEMQHFAEIVEVAKWSMTIDQDTIEVGTKLTYSYTYGDTTETYNVMAGEYETVDGKAFLVDSEGVVRMFLDAEQPASAQAQNSDEEMSAELEGVKATANSILQVAEQMSEVIKDLNAKIEAQEVAFTEIKGRFEKFASQPSDNTKENNRFARVESNTFNATQQRLLDSMNK